MTLDRQTKEQLVEHYSSGFARAQNALVLGYRGVTVPQVTQLRARIREVGALYEVVKNSLAQRALQDSEMAALAEHFEGPTAVAYSDTDIVGLAKVLTDFSKEVPAVEIKAGLLEGAPIAVEDIKEIAELPTRDELVAKVLFLLQSPISRLVRGLGAITPQFVRVLEQIRQRKDSQSP